MSTTALASQEPELVAKAPASAYGRRWRWLASTLLTVAVTLTGLLLVTFMLGRVLPTDPVLKAVGDRAPQELYDRVYKEMGLDKPLPEQFVLFANEMLHGRFGKSTVTGNLVADDIARYFPATFELATLAILLGVLFGVPMGVLCARYAGRWPDHLARIRQSTARQAEALADLAGVQKPGLFQHPAGGGVVREMTRHQGAPLPALRRPDQGSIQRLRRITPPPIRPTDPVADLGGRILIFKQTDDADRTMVLMLDQEGRGAAGILSGDGQDEFLGIGAGIGVRHAQGHPRDVRVVGQVGQTADILRVRTAQRQTPRLQNGGGFDHAHRRRLRSCRPLWRARAARGGERKRGAW